MTITTTWRTAKKDKDDEYNDGDNRINFEVGIMHLPAYIKWMYLPCPNDTSNKKDNIANGDNYYTDARLY